MNDIANGNAIRLMQHPLRHPMKGRDLRIIIGNSERTALLMAQRLIAAITSASDTGRRFVFAPSAGRTFQRTYEVLTQQYRNSADWSRVVCVQMDEYEGIARRDPRSFAFQLQQQLVAPLGIGQLLTFFDERGLPEMTLANYEKRVDALGGLDFVFHGLGRNGHVAFNEPQEIYPGDTRRVRLDPLTRMANEVDFKNGVSLGMNVLLRARTSVVALTGAAKRSAAHMLIDELATPRNPAGYLRRLRDLTIYMDDEAAAMPWALPGHEREADKTSAVALGRPLHSGHDKGHDRWAIEAFGNR